MPEGNSLLEEIERCEKVLMIPQVSILEHEDPYLRPENDVDLSFAALPAIPGKLL